MRLRVQQSNRMNVNMRQQVQQSSEMLEMQTTYMQNVTQAHVSIGSMLTDTIGRKITMMDGCETAI